MRKLPLQQKIFFLTLYLITFITIYSYVISNNITLTILKDYQYILFFSTLTFLTETFSMNFTNISFSTTFAITVATFFLFGPFISAVIFIIGFCFRILKIGNGKYKHIFNTPFYGTVFNCCALTLPIFAGNYFFVKVGGVLGKNIINNIPVNIFPIALFSLVYLLVNTFIISFLQSLYTKKNVLYCFIKNLKLMFLNILAMTPLGMILAIIFIVFHYTGVLLSIFPIILARFTFSLYVDAKNQYIQTVDALTRAIEARDKYTEGHSQRVADISVSIAKKFKYSEFKLEQLKLAAIMHDVGKIGISDAILNKPGKLDNDEFDIIKSHPVIGYNILKEIKNLNNISDAVRSHHERYDGRGYPDGKKGDELDLDVYIIQMADSVDAMMTDRPYRRGLAIDIVIKEIEKNTGTQFHPKVAETYLEILKKE